MSLTRWPTLVTGIQLLVISLASVSSMTLALAPMMAVAPAPNATAEASTEAAVASHSRPSVPSCTGIICHLMFSTMCLLREAWKECWFVLWNGKKVGGLGILQYHQNDRDSKPLGSIDLKSSEQVDIDVTQKELHGSYMFDIKTGERAFYLMAETWEDWNKWAQSISQICGFTEVEKSTVRFQITGLDSAVDPVQVKNVTFEHVKGVEGGKQKLQEVVEFLKNPQKFIVLAGKLPEGPERRSVEIDNKNKIVTAYHESGHAIIAYYTKDAMPIDKATIVPRGSILGENALFKEHSQASYVTAVTGDMAVYFSFWGADQMAFRQDSFERAKHILKTHAKEHKNLTEALLTYETLDAKEIQIVLEGKKLEQFRTALHLACANGHSEVVTLLVDRKCQLNMCDSENRTALVKAVQCQEEECATILLEHGADPNLTDVHGNTALHYAVYNENIPITAKLLLHNANTEAKNKGSDTPVLALAHFRSPILAACVGLCEIGNRGVSLQKVVGALGWFTSTGTRRRTKANTRGENEVSLKPVAPAMKKIFSKKGESPLASFSSRRRTGAGVGCEHGNGVYSQPGYHVRDRDLGKIHKAASLEDGSSEDSLSRLSDKPGIDDSWPTSDDEDLDFDTKNVPKPSLTKLMTASQQSRKNLEAQYGTVRMESAILTEDRISESPKEEVVEGLPSRPVKVQAFAHPAFPSPGPRPKPSLTALANRGLTEEGTTKPATGKKENGVGIDSPLAEQTDDNLTFDGVCKNNRSDMMSALGLGQEEDIESPWDSESISENLPQKYVDHLSGAADQKEEDTVNGQVEDVFYIPSCMSGSRNFKMAKLEDTRNVDIPVAHMESPKKYPHLKPTIEIEECVLNKAVGVKDKHTYGSAEHDLEEVTSEEEQESLEGRENNEPQKKSQEPEMDKDCDRENVSVDSRLLSVQKDEEMWIKQGKLEWKNKLKLSTNALKPKCGEISEKYKIPACPEEEPLHGNAKGEANLKKMPSNLTNHLLDCEEKDTTISVVFQAFLEQKEPSLKNGFPSPSYSGSPEYSCQSSSKLYLNDNKLDSENNNKTDTEHVFNTNEENFCNDTKTKKVRNPEVVTVEMKEDQEFEIQMTESMNQNSDNRSANNYKSMEPELQNVSSSLPHSDRTSKVYLKEELQQDMQRFKNEIGMLKVEFLALEKEKFRLQKEVEEERKKHKSKEMEVSENLYDGAAAAADGGFIQQRKSGKTDDQQFTRKEKEKCDRFTLKQEEEKKRNADMLYEKNREQLRRKEEQYRKEVEAKQQLELTLRTLDMELRTVRNNLDQVSHSHENEEDLLHKNHMLQDEIAMLRLEIDTIKIQNQEKEKKYFEDIEIVKEKNDDLQKTIKLNEETLTKTISQYSGQLSVLTAENTMLNSKLENEKQTKERLETEVESYRSRLAAAMHDCDQSQTSKRDLELAFQRAREEWFRLQDKMNFDVSNLKDNNEILSQQLSRTESKFNSLEIELHHTRDALREKTLVLEGVQRDLSQTQSQMKEIEQMYQNEQGKVNKYIGKQESVEERLSQLQSENMLLRQQLDDAQNKADNKEKTVISIQDQFHAIVKKLEAESEKQSLLLEERNKELINECNHLKERQYQYENEKAEREVSIKKEIFFRLPERKFRLEEARDQHAEAVRCAERTQDHMQKLEKENSKLKVTIKKQADKIERLQKNLLSASSCEDEKEELKKLTELKQSLEYNLDQEVKKNDELEKELSGFKNLLKMTRKKLNEYENGDFSVCGDLKTSRFETDVQINKLKHKIDDLTAELETASSKCLHLDTKNQTLRQELSSMKTIQKKCEKLQKNKTKLEQEVVNLKSHIEINMVELGQVEQYKREIEERARQDIVEKLKEVNLFLQTQAASQENLEQLRENHIASIRSQMELRIKDLESELSKMKTSQEDFNKMELEKYKQLYLEELKFRKSLATKLNKTNEKLAEVSTKLLVEKQQTRSLFTTLATRPVLESPCVGNLNNGLVLNRKLIPRENLVIPTSSPRTSNNSMENYLTKMQQELEKNITRELEEAAAELETESYIASPVGSTDESNLNQDLVWKASREYVQILKKNYMI
ncbi:PREDICTED: ankyrin repeat domain-containing protein 26 [Propithecus coquereli]|uniref:ankyrin repeat domain-containing protein 26 n=1 Tax=Propithecus coquereli TaxID=379532 RepID=UPI00063F848C|nr:PREDICTED: ankyrin repeat domain-containing protein 26 [Propithecus coquereli]